jgi:hypothetical protein
MTSNGCSAFARTLALRCSSFSIMRASLLLGSALHLELHGDMPFHRFADIFGPLSHALITRVTDCCSLVTVQQRMCLCHIGNIARGADGGVDLNGKLQLTPQETDFGRERLGLRRKEKQVYSLWCVFQRVFEPSPSTIMLLAALDTAVALGVTILLGQLGEHIENGIKIPQSSRGRHL